MRYTPARKLHPILGPNVEVRDLQKALTVTLFAGPRAWELAEARCAELNQKKEAENGKELAR